MIKKYFIKHDRTTEVIDWLSSNIGKENNRWWTSRVGMSEWDSQHAKFNQGFDVYIDLTEEEEPWLTAFILKYDV